MHRHLVSLSALLVLAVAPVRAAMSPAVDTVSLMDLRFYEQRGAFLVEHLQLVFPQQANETPRLVIRKAGGGEVTGVNLHTSGIGFASFAALDPVGPGVLEVGQAGDYVIGVELGGKMITSFPFTMHASAGDDPFAPKKEFSRDGPWNQLAYLAQRTAQPDEPLTFDWWSRLSQVAGASPPQCTVQMMLDGRAVARSETPVVVGTTTWQHFSRPLVSEAAKNNGFTHAMLTAHDGTYEARLDCGGKRVRTYSLRVASGRVVEIPRTRLGHQPQEEFLPPRRIDTSSGSGSSYRMQTVYWMTATQ